MNFLVLGRDIPGGAARRRHRPAHLEFVEGQQDKILFAGPLIEGGEMVGSVFLFNVPDRATLDAYLSTDPYFTAPIFERVEIFETRRMVPETEPGALAREAEKARQAARA